MKEKFLLNAFSLQMIDFPAIVKIEEIAELPDGFSFKFLKVVVQ